MNYSISAIRRFGGALQFAAGLLAADAGAALAAAPADIRPLPPDQVAVLVGAVRDSSGAPLPNVQVHLVTLQRTTITDQQGQFSFRGLGPGSHHLDSYFLGFAPGHADVMVPAGSDTVRLVITMRQTPLRLQGVQVTATPTGDTRSATQATTALSGQALSRNLGASVAQTLAGEPGVAMRFNGPAANAPVIRGLSGDRVLVLQDGQRSGDLSSASSDHAVTIDPLAAHRIEVVRGPASLLYGSSALGGVVNVIENDIPDAVPAELTGFLAGQTESVNPGGSGSLELTVPVGAQWALTARGSARSISDYSAGGGLTLPNTFSHNQSGAAGIGYVASALNGGLAYRGSRFDYGLPAPAGDAELGAHIDGRRDEVLGRTNLAFGASGVRSLRLDGTAQWYSHDEIESSGGVGTSFSLRTQTLNALARTATDRLNGAIGAQTLFKQYAATGEEALTPAANSSSIGAFAFQELAVGSGRGSRGQPASLQAGARVDRYVIRSKPSPDPKFGEAVARSFTKFSGSLGASVPLTSAISVSGSLARAFRAPTVEELFSNGFHAALGTFDVGDARLEAETNTGIEGVLRMEADRVTAQVAAYYNRIDGFITPGFVGDTAVTADGELVTVPLNRYTQADAALRGVEGQAEFRVARHVVLGTMGDLVRGTFGQGGDPLPLLPAARLAGSARYDDGHLSVGGELRHAFARTDVAAAGSCPLAGEVDDATPVACVDLPTAAHTVVDLSTGYRLILGGYVHSVTLRADNVGDVRYYDATSRIKRFAPNPGRNVSLVYKLLF